MPNTWSMAFTFIFKTQIFMVLSEQIPYFLTLSILPIFYINFTFALTFPPPCTILFNYDRKRRKSYVHENEERQCP